MSALEALAAPEVSLVAHTIQLAVAPVFLLAGIGGFLNVCASRLARIIDRARALEKMVPDTVGEEHDRLIDEIRILDRRMGIVNFAILLSVIAALMICAVVVLLFASNLLDVNLGTLVALLFIGSMVAIGGGFGTFIVETRLSAKAVRIRNDILYHRADGGSGGEPARG